ncbi:MULTISPECIES: GTP pyrophosphokinase [Yimella]|uniref:PpGpp synthetase/RelA/SpoT-type nucleotidyltransferase n=1 Tax=Yimella lutea TaxID=587872 RepID=A0A542EE17_9MICO|nr:MULTISPECIES: GTP pyrophosphokinase [Yimella]MCG8656216.1 GTP pyrophosphokinase [Yimella sp. NH-Cas1]TQJ13540.1 ppGpp synthetase/RelA/SpoT-type nucleotidyltransferase [Yimella lutea]
MPSSRGSRPLPHQEVVRRATQQYASLHPKLRVAAEEAVDLVVGILDDAGLNYLTVTGRAKSVESFADKAGRLRDGTPVYPDPMSDIGDVIGLRVITYVRSDVAAVAQLLATEAVVLDDRDMGSETASEGRWGYASRHLQIQLSAEDRKAHPKIGDRHVQVQIRTVLQHAWAEFEHDIRYKGTVPDEYRSDFDRRFSLAAGLLELADLEFSAIRERLQRPVHAPSSGDPEVDPRIDPRELAAFLAGQYADASWSRPEHYAWMSGLVLELGITSLTELADAIRSIDVADVDRRMGYRNPPGAVRRLDDVLLVAFGERYIDLHDNSHRVDRLKTRLAKMKSAG